MAKLAKNFSEFLDRPNFSVVLNTEGLYFLIYDKRFRDVVRKSDLIFCDGIGLKIALNLSGIKHVNRLHGPDLFHETLHEDHGKKQLIVGGTDKAHGLLLAKYDNLMENQKVGFYSEIVKENELSSLTDMVSEYDPEIIYICLGIRKQEYVGAKLKQEFPECHIAGVGAAIDFESGNVERSSSIFQKYGLEWLPRMIKERRMIPRVIRSLWALLIYSVLGVLRIKIDKIDLVSIVDKR